MPLVQFVRELYENPLNAMSCLENQDRKSLKAEHFWKQKIGSKRREISHFTCPDSLKYGDFASFWPTSNFLEKLNYHVGFTAVYICFYLFTLSKISCKAHSARSLDVLSKPQPVRWFQPFSWRPSWPLPAFLFQSSSDTLLPPSQKTIKTICNHCNLRSWKIFCLKTPTKMIHSLSH